VYLVHRRDELRAAKMLQEKFFALPNVTFVKDSVLKSIDGEDCVETVTVSNVKDGSESKINVNGVFIAVGIKPESSLVSGIASMDERGYIIADESCVTDAPGFFAAGDVRTKALRQVVTAVADGANAVTSADAYLLNIK
nr:FAD-dependent oxidoreductase [Lachnospiraceae bacterium]